MFRSLVLGLCLLGSTAAFVAAQEPPAPPPTRLIPFSAVLPVAGADAPAGARAVTFALFDEPEGGTMLWTETQLVTTDGRGRYTAHLGAQAPLPRCAGNQPSGRASAVNFGVAETR